MFPVDSGSPARYTPPPPPPPKPHVVTSGETVTSVAKAYNVTPEELARSNNITVDTALTPGQSLQLPADATDPVHTAAAPAAQTPAQKTDAAIAAYQQAVKDRSTALDSAPRNMGIRSEINQEESAKVDTARTAMNKAIDDEIAGEVALRNQGVPGQFRTPADQIISSAGNAILARHQGDADATGDIKSEIGDYQTRSTANDLIPGYSGNWSAEDKLKGIDLQGQPKAVVDAVLNDPRVKQWISDAAHDAAGKSTADCAKYLADLSRSAPDLGRAVTAQWWNAQDDQSFFSSNAAVLDVMSDPEVYKNLTVVFKNLGGSDQGQNVQQAFASDVARYLERNSMVANRTDVTQAISQGGDPALALAVASDLKANGKNDLATQMVQSVKSGVGLLEKVQIKQDMQAYAKQTEELNKMLKDLGPGLTDAQKQKAIKAYIDGKGKDWQNQLTDAKNKIIADVRSFNTDLAALSTLPDNIKSLGVAPGDVDGMIDDNTQEAIEFAASQDPSVFEGEEGGEAAKLMIELSHKGKDFTATVGKAYVTGNLMPSLSGLNPNDPKTVALATSKLESLRGTMAKMFGVPQKEVDEGIDKLEDVLKSLKSESLEDAMQGKGINALADTQKELSELKELPFTDARMGMLFRTMAFGITGAAFINQTGKTIDDPTVQNVLGTMAFGLDLAPSKTAFANTIQALDKNGVLERWGFGASELTEKFIGVLNIGYFAAGTFQGLADKDYPTAIFSAVGAGGSALAAFGGEEMLGGFAGPIGIAIATVAVVALHFVEQHNQAQEYKEAQNKFLEGAGIENAGERDQLIGAGPDQLTAMRNRGMSPEQIQDIAENDPQFMHIAYGNDPQGRPY